MILPQSFCRLFESYPCDSGWCQQRRLPAFPSALELFEAVHFQKPFSPRSWRTSSPAHWKKIQLIFSQSNQSFCWILGDEVKYEKKLIWKQSALSAFHYSSPILEADIDGILSASIPSQLWWCFASIGISTEEFIGSNMQKRVKMKIRSQTLKQFFRAEFLS